MSAAQNNWMPRRKEEGPKTIKQIQQEVKQVGESEQLQIKKGQNLMRGRGAGKSTDRDVIHGRLDQSSSCDCDGNRKQACHCGSSSALTPEENRCWRTQNARNTRQKEPVSFQDEERLNRGDQSKYVSRITGDATEESKSFAAFLMQMGCFTTFSSLQLSTRTPQTRETHRQRLRMKVQEPCQRPPIIWSL